MRSPRMFFITSVVRYPMVYTVRPDSPIKSFKDMIERAKTDPGKVSKQGILSVHAENGQLVTKSRMTLAPVAGDQLELVFLNGNMVAEYTLAEIRQRAIG